MNETKLFEIIARILDVPTSTIDDQSNPESIERWDSFTGYVLLDEIETEFNVSITMDEALEVKNVGDFKSILKSKGVNFE